MILRHIERIEIVPFRFHLRSFHDRKPHRGKNIACLIDKLGERMQMAFRHARARRGHINFFFALLVMEFRLNKRAFFFCKRVEKIQFGFMRRPAHRFFLFFIEILQRAQHSSKHAFLSAKIFQPQPFELLARRDMRKLRGRFFLYMFTLFCVDMHVHSDVIASRANILRQALLL